MLLRTDRPINDFGRNYHGLAMMVIREDLRKQYRFVDAEPASFEKSVAVAEDREGKAV